MKRAMRTEPGNITVGEVNDMLDQLALNTKEYVEYTLWAHVILILSERLNCLYSRSFMRI